MEGRHERLNKQYIELEKEWEAMKTGKGSSAVSCSSTIEVALEFVENSPRKLMLSLQHDQACPEAEVRSPCRRKLFHESDDDNEDETKMTHVSHSTCWSSNVMRVGETNNTKEKKKNKRGMIVCVSMVVILLMSMLFLAVVVMDGFDDHGQINTLVPT